MQWQKYKTAESKRQRNAHTKETKGYACNYPHTLKQTN